MEELLKCFKSGGFQIFYSKILNNKFEKFNSEKELKAFIYTLFSENRENPDANILEFLYFLKANKNPFSKIDNNKYNNILQFNILKYYITVNNNDKVDEVFKDINEEGVEYIDSLVFLGAFHSRSSNYGKSFLLCKQAEELLEHYEKKEDLSAIKTVLYGNLSYIYIKAKQFEKAAECYKKTIENFNNKDSSYYWLVYLNHIEACRLAGIIKSDTFLEQLKETRINISKKFPNLIVNLVAFKANCYLKEGDYKRAFELIKEIDSDNLYEDKWILIIYLSSIYHLGKYDEFELLYKKEIDGLIDFDSFEPEYELIEKAIELAKKNKDRKWEKECLRHKIEFDFIYYKKSKLFMLEMAQGKHLLNINSKMLVFEKEKAKDQVNFNKILVKKNRELQQFASIVAHDIKSPLRSIVNLLSILESTLNLDETELEIFNLIKTSNKKLDKFIDDLVNYARYGNSVDTFYFVDLNLIFEELQILLKENILKNNATIKIKEKLPSLYAYNGACTQLFLNLINNSIKFRKPDSNPLIEIWYKKERKTTSIYLKDNGVGIKKEDIEKIFQPFKRGTTEHVTEGIGIGLATCQNIIDNINASISVESKINEGSTFKIEVSNLLTKFD